MTASGKAVSGSRTLALLEKPMMETWTVSSAWGFTLSLEKILLMPRRAAARPSPSMDSEQSRRI
jgi:hypothetical protein